MTNTSVTFEIVDTDSADYGDSVEMPAPALGDSEIIDLKTNFNMSMSGVVYSYIKTNTSSKYHMSFSVLTYDQKEELLAFLDKAMGYEIEMTYHDGTIVDGHFVNDPTVAKNKRLDLYDIVIDFEGDSP